MDKPKRMRIDKLLVDHGYFESKNAQRSILAGEVLVEERVIDKRGHSLNAGIRGASSDCAEENALGGKFSGGALDHLLLLTALVCWMSAPRQSYTDCLLRGKTGDRR
jgi:hypothetical protein